MNKSVQKKLRAVAEILPGMKYATTERIEISGADLILSGTKEVEGKAVDIDKVYLMKSPVIHEVAHYKRLKKAFVKSGVDGIKRYLSDYVFDIQKLNSIVDILFFERKQGRA